MTRKSFDMRNKFIETNRITLQRILCRIEIRNNVIYFVVPMEISTR